MEEKVLAISCINTPAEGSTKGGVGCGRRGRRLKDLSGAVLAVPCDGDAASVNFVDEIHPVARKSAVAQPNLFWRKVIMDGTVGGFWDVKKLAGRKVDVKCGIASEEEAVGPGGFSCCIYFEK